MSTILTAPSSPRYRRICYGNHPLQRLNMSKPRNCKVSIYNSVSQLELEFIRRSGANLMEDDFTTLVDGTYIIALRASKAIVANGLMLVTGCWLIRCYWLKTKLSHGCHNIEPYSCCWSVYRFASLIMRAEHNYIGLQPNPWVAGCCFPSLRATFSASTHHNRKKDLPKPFLQWKSTKLTCKNPEHNLQDFGKS